jgi:hypothetical protein
MMPRLVTATPAKNHARHRGSAGRAATTPAPASTSDTTPT